MDPLQAMINGMNEHYQKERATMQMTLGKLIQRLDELGTTSVENFDEPHSYRGYYVDLAFEPVSGTRPANELLEMCRECMGKVFEGYKGGDFMMGESTPVWISHYGMASGGRIMGITDEGGLELASDEVLAQ